ncbi:MAG: photosystem II stability/assembly factor-like uncharacterized protein [Planctomycetota bacterium]|jgi:photosystem II stability/assembly factor-like uncharacterized protein
MTPQNNLILVSNWEHGVVVFNDDQKGIELEGIGVQSLTRDTKGRALAIVAGHQLQRRSERSWETLAESEFYLSCAVVVGDEIFVGTDDARVLRLGRDGELTELLSFQTVKGRDEWYAGQVVVNGMTLGPPLGVRSMTATADNAVLLVNVHVGGIARSDDGGETWHPTIDINSDVHEVRAHPHDKNRVIAASAVGFCHSSDAGATWSIDGVGLHATYCSAVAFDGDDALIAASDDHFSPEGAIYRHKANQKVQLEQGGLPTRIGGIADTRCLDSLGDSVAIVDKSGSLFVRSQEIREWQVIGNGLTGASSVLILTS